MDSDLICRPRRLRNNITLRKMVRETRMDPSSLIYPIFIEEGEGKKEEIKSMPCQYRWSVDRMGERLNEVADAGVGAIMLFGIPAYKDESGSGAYARDGIIQKALRRAKSEVPDLLYITDVCMCEYTDHGHCGILSDTGRGILDVDNDRTLEKLSQIALSQVQAGSDMVAPSDMMDGRVEAIRRTLDENGFSRIPIMSYAVKYASSFYGPFRDAADSAPKAVVRYGESGMQIPKDRQTYQMDFHNVREGLKEAELDVEEGADIIMVKPAMSFLDVVCKVREITDVPVATYSVSGEYAMVKAASMNGWIDEDRIVGEMAVSAFRAGAQIYETYYAEKIARLIKSGAIG